MTWLKRIVGISILFLICASTVHAADPINTLDRKGLFGYKPSGIAIRGYDTVAYFTQGKPVEGQENYSTEWAGAKWHFSSEDHLELFINDPEKYAPQYGGYCAYGVSQNYLVKIEPENWSIVEGKLFLNYDSDVQEKWEKDIAGFIELADSKFDNLLKSEK